MALVHQVRHALGGGSACGILACSNGCHGSSSGQPALPAGLEARPLGVSHQQCPCSAPSTTPQALCSGPRKHAHVHGTAMLGVFVDHSLQARVEVVQILITHALVGWV